MMLTAGYKVVLLALKLMNKMLSEGLESGNSLQSLTNPHFFLYFLRVSQGNGHYFPVKSQSCESHIPLLANEDMWDESDDGSEDGSLGEIPLNLDTFMVSRTLFVESLEYKYFSVSHF